MHDSEINKKCIETKLYKTKLNLRENIYFFYERDTKQNDARWRW